MTAIHPTAIVDGKAELDPSVTVGPYAVIGAAVRIAAGTTIGAHCVVEGRTTIGRDNRIFPFASLGAAPQDMKYGGEPTELVIGERNTIREFCTFNRGTAQDVPPFMMVAGNPLAVHGFNVEGLRRRGFSRERIAQVKQMHRLLYRDGLTLEQAKAAIAALKGTVAEGDADVQLLLDFLAAATRGIAR
jgi:acyl-[acyl carrier protein]--UDP-N-acetylglucosamine O-acyltransferase